MRKVTHEIGCLKFRDTSIIRRFRNRLGLITAKDAKYDEEARTYVWTYDSDTDPDENIYFKHHVKEDESLCKYFCVMFVKDFVQCRRCHNRKR